jgi:hypothetical protein
MMTSTVLTLVVIPVVYSLVDDARGWIPALLGWCGSFGRRRKPIQVVTSAVAPAANSVLAKSIASRGKESRVNVEMVIIQDPRSRLPD